MITVQHSAKDDRIYFKQALSLHAAGFELSIVHGSQDGQLKDMSGNLVEEGKDKFGVHHLAVKEPEDLKSKLAKKVFKGPFYRDFISKACETEADVFVAHEAQSIYIARKCAEKTGGTYVFDAHESLHLNSPKAKYAIRKEMPNMPFFTSANKLTQDAILAFNPGAISEVIYNASPIPSSAVRTNLSPLIVHEGSLPFNRGLELMMEAFVLLKKSIPDFRFKIVGSVKGEELDYFNRMVKEHDFSNNIELTGWQPYETLAHHLKDAAIGLILNTPTPNNLNAGPANKLFNYMASNCCIVAADLPETTRILAERKSGITLEDRNPETLAKELIRLISNAEELLSFRMASYEAHKILNWDEESKKLVSYYNRIISSS
jgi:glycosyltransferase involved in cell wall biosynthesis